MCTELFSDKCHKVFGRSHSSISKIVLLREKLKNCSFQYCKSRVLHAKDNPTRANVTLHENVKEIQHQKAVEHLTSPNAIVGDPVALDVIDACMGSAGDRLIKSENAICIQNATKLHGEALSRNNDEMCDAKIMAEELIFLRQKCSELQKLADRYKSIFREKIKAFREACFLLFGFKIDMAHQDAASMKSGDSRVQFTLKSVFSPNPHDTLQFHLTSNGLEMGHTRFSEQPYLKEQRDIFIGRFQSFPAFLANMTMELFQQQTQI